MNAREVAQAIGVSYTAIYRWVSQGMPYQLEPKGIQMVMRFNLHEVRAWVDTQRREAQGA